MSIYCSFCTFDSEGWADDGQQAPLVYQESHILPSVGDDRGGSFSLGYIPGFITRDGRDVEGEEDPQCEHEGVWPFVRVGVWDGIASDGAAVVLDRDQVEHLRDELSEWLLRCDDPAAWLDRRS